MKAVIYLKERSMHAIQTELLVYHIISKNLLKLLSCQ